MSITRVREATTRGWAPFKRNPLATISIILVLIFIAMIFLPHRQEESLIDSRFVFGQNDSAAIGKAVGEAVEPQFQLHAKGINLLIDKFKELAGRMGAAEKRLDANGTTLKSLETDVKALGQQKFDRSEFDKAIKPYLDRIEKLKTGDAAKVSSLEKKNEELAKANQNFPISSAV